MNTLLNVLFVVIVAICGLSFIDAAPLHQAKWFACLCMACIMLACDTGERVSHTFACVTANDIYLEGVFGVDDGRDHCDDDHEDMDYSSGPHDRHVIELWNYIRGLPITLGELAVKVDDAGWHIDAEAFMATADTFCSLAPEMWHRGPLEREISEANQILNNGEWKSYWFDGDCCTFDFYEEDRSISLRDELWGHGCCIDGCWLVHIKPELVWLAEMYVEEGILEEAVVEVESHSDENHYEPTGSYGKAPAWEPKDSDIPF
jgi:hypothetical protein